MGSIILRLKKSITIQEINPTVHDRSVFEEITYLVLCFIYCETNGVNCSNVGIKIDSRGNSICHANNLLLGYITKLTRIKLLISWALIVLRSTPTTPMRYTTHSVLGYKMFLLWSKSKCFKFDKFIEKSNIFYLR